MLVDPYKKTELLVDFLQKRPDDDFKKFCDALARTNQIDVVIQYLDPQYGLFLSLIGHSLAWL